MELDEYKTLSEKDANFVCFRPIDRREELDRFIKEMEMDRDNKHLIYRGVSEAKYKIYTSAQRHWITQELEKTGKSFDDFIQALIDNASSSKNNNKLLSRYFKSFNIPINDFLILSYLQHYKAPSPLIDFTNNIYKSLFFCFDESSYTSCEDIGNYCSLYIINTDYIRGHNELISLPDFLNEACDKIDRTLQKHPGEKIGTNHVEKMIQGCPYSQFKDLRLLLIPGIKSGSRSHTIRSIPYFVANTYISNLNLIAQEGVFIFYNDPHIPLEEYFSGGNNQVYTLKQITCANIHKSLKEYVVEKLLKPRHITPELMYPQEEDIARRAFDIFQES